MPEWHGQFMRVAMHGRGDQSHRIDYHFVYFDNTRGDAVNCFRSYTMFGALRRTNFRGNEFQFLDTVSTQSKLFIKVFFSLSKFTNS